MELLESNPNESAEDYIKRVKHRQKIEKCKTASFMAYWIGLIGAVFAGGVFYAGIREADTGGWLGLAPLLLSMLCIAGHGFEKGELAILEQDEEDENFE